jgi:hypothetical protein
MNAIQKADTQTSLATQSQTAGILSSDVIIPRLFLMQKTSEFVEEGRANAGDLVKSLGVEKLGDLKTPIEVIPLASPVSSWTVQKREVGKQRWDFARSEPRHAGNDTLSWNFNADKDGNIIADNVKSTHEWRRVKTLSCFVILPKDLEAQAAELLKAEQGELPDLSKALTPLLVTFRITSYTAGKELSTFFTQAASFKQEAYKYSLTLGAAREEGDQGSYYIFTLDRSKPKPVKKEYLEKVEMWANIVRSTNVRVDEDRDHVAEAPAEGNY